MKAPLICMAMIVSLGLSSSLFAAPPEDKAGKGKPPIEAIKACKDKKANTTCSFKGRKGAVMKGQCHKRGETMACKPERHGKKAEHKDRKQERKAERKAQKQEKKAERKAQKQERRALRKKARQACKDKKINHNCSFQGHKGKVSGQCLQGKHKKLVCKPQR